MSEGSLYFEGKGAVQGALRRIAARLDELAVPYAIVGGMALFQHGYRRFTEDVDILVTRDGLKAIHQALEGRGYVRPFAKSKNLRDTEEGVKIEFLIAGDYPGDGRPKEVQFPDPASVSEVRDGIRFVRLPALVELKLAAGITGADRRKDLADVQELIKLLRLPDTFAEQLAPSVRAKFHDLWDEVHRHATRFVTTWPLPPSPRRPTSLEDLIDLVADKQDLLQAMRSDGVTLDPERSSDDTAWLVTTDPRVAEKYGMQDETEMWDEDE